MDQREIRRVGRMKPHRSPKDTIRAYCLYCTGGRTKEVESCDGNDPAFHQCAFHQYRMGKKRPSVKVMRQFCLQCMGNCKASVRDCETRDCMIHPYRMGKNPARTGKGASRERMLEISQKRRAVSR